MAEIMHSGSEVRQVIEWKFRIIEKICSIVESRHTLRGEVLVSISNGYNYSAHCVEGKKI